MIKKSSDKKKESYYHYLLLLFFVIILIPTLLLSLSFFLLLLLGTSSNFSINSDVLGDCLCCEGDCAGTVNEPAFEDVASSFNWVRQDNKL